MVDEWDNYEEQIIASIKQNNEIEKEIIIMSKKRVLVRLSKDYNVAEVEVSEIDNVNDFHAEAGWAIEQAKGILKSYGEKEVVRTTPTEYVKATQVATKPANGVYTLAHITTKFLKGKQFDYALKGLNAGKIDIDALNNAQNWQESNAIVFPPR
jgi:ribosome-binding factor A